MKAKVLFCYIKKNKQPPNTAPLETPLTKFKSTYAENTEQTPVLCAFSNKDLEQQCLQAGRFFQSQRAPPSPPCSEGQYQSQHIVQDSFRSLTVIPKT